VINSPFAVKGEIISSTQIDAAIDLMARQRDFTFMQVGGALYRAGVTWDNHDRAADRLLQRLRKLGQVKFSKGRWSSCKNDAESV
jgi:hypothetical protein